VDPYGIGFVENAVQMLHHPVIKLPASLSHVLLFAFEATGQIDYSGCGTFKNWENNFFRILIPIISDCNFEGH
jgi:hypothetical protein